MGKRVQKFLSLWLAVALFAAPWPAFSFAPAGSGGGSCLMAQAGNGSAHQASADAEQVRPDCSRCKGDTCHEGGCANPGCAPCHGATTAVLTPIDRPVAVTTSLYRRPETGPLSRTDPPLLRPPAILHS